MAELDDWEDNDWETAGEADFALPEVSGAGGSSSTVPGGTDAAPREDGGDDDDWLERQKPDPAVAPVTASTTKERHVDEDDRPPLILVDFTVLSEGAIHNKFDAHGVNDVEAKSALSKKASEASSVLQLSLWLLISSMQ